jgi:predicted MFS family arabinose efflux permease
MLAVGAAVGGIVAATLGREAAFILDSASFAVSAALLIGVTRPFQLPRKAGADEHKETGLLGSLRPVYRFARHSRFVSSLLLTKTLFGVGTGTIVLLAVFGEQVFHAGALGIGLLFAARGIGALLGPFIARATFGTSDRGLLVGISVSIVCVAAAYGLFPLAPSILVAAGLVLIAHLGGGAQWMLSTFGLQRHTPDAIRGRVFSFDYALVTLAIAASNIIAGVLADLLTPEAAVWAMVGLLALAGVAWFWFSTPARRRASRVTDEDGAHEIGGAASAT